MFTEEKAKIGIADFCSKLGGILNLWAGITVVILLEIVELLDRIILFKIQSKTRENQKTKVKNISDSPEKNKKTIGKSEKAGGFFHKGLKFHDLDAGFHGNVDYSSQFDVISSQTDLMDADQKIRQAWITKY